MVKASAHGYLNDDIKGLHDKFENLALNDNGPSNDGDKKKRRRRPAKKTPQAVLVSNWHQMSPTFESMNLPPLLLQGIYAQGMEKPSAVQQRAIVPSISGRDAIIQGQSGMGKTACFVISTLARIFPTTTGANNNNNLLPKSTSSKRCPVSALVLSPTRELARQIEKEFRKIGGKVGVNTCTCIGGTRTEWDIMNLEEGGIHVVIGTPGRILHLVEMGAIKTESIKVLVLDEADEMLAIRVERKKVRGWKFHLETLFQIFSGPQTQKILTSATIPKDILEVTRPFMSNPLTILVRDEELTLEGITQFRVDLSGGEIGDSWQRKVDFLMDIYDKISVTQTIIFCNTRKTVETLSKLLIEKELPISFVHGLMGQGKRQKVLNDFRLGKSRVLLSTDLFARGIDVQQVSLVINFDIPFSTVIYIHRVGRGGRFGRKGVAITLLTSEFEKTRLDNIEEFYATKITPLTIDALRYL